MTITDEARVILEKMLKEEEKNTLSISVVANSNGNQLLIDTLNTDDAPVINGIQVLMNEAAIELLMNVTLVAVNDTDLAFRYNGGCGGGCGGCGGGCGSGGCGGCGGDCGCGDE